MLSCAAPLLLPSSRGWVSENTPKFSLIMRFCSRDLNPDAICNDSFFQVSMETLLTLTEDDFIDLGIESLGLCKVAEYIYAKFARVG